MVSLDALEHALELLHRNRSALQLKAEVDPRSLIEVASELAEQTGLDRDVALRVVEDELGVRPLTASGSVTRGRTMLEIPITVDD